MRIVIAGHVDHGKSTVIGRILADTGSLPQGKLEQVKVNCAKNAKPFEYAFLLDALKDEQAQGITIDAARCFFQTQRRHYIIIDAPGHIEFLKNMVTGAANAEAALIVIDAKEGIQENTKRHGYLVSMLGLKQVVVAVNKMDLTGYSQAVFEQTERDYRKFLSEFNLNPVAFVPVSAFFGENMIEKSTQMPWYQGLSLLEQIDALERETLAARLAQPFRFPLQGVYKFTEEGDERRIFSGTVETGKVSVGDEVIFLPSNKKSRVQSVEEFNRPPADSAQAGQAIGFTLNTQVYVQPGELLVKTSETQPQVASRFKANIFWMGRAPLIKNKRYKLKIAAKRIQVRLVELVSVIDASDLGSELNKQQVDRHDVAECIFETVKPIAFDLSSQVDATARFVLVDDFEIAGGGIILGLAQTNESMTSLHVRHREEAWVRGWINQAKRAQRNGHQARCVLFTGDFGQGRRKMAAALEKRLFEANRACYFMAYTNLNLGLDSDFTPDQADRVEELRRLGELARVMTDAGLIFISVVSVEDGFDLELLKKLNEPNEMIVVNVGENRFAEFQVDLNVEPHSNEGRVADEVIAILERHQVL